MSNPQDTTFVLHVGPALCLAWLWVGIGYLIKPFKKELGLGNKMIQWKGRRNHHLMPLPYIKFLNKQA
jgi:hypothetical protein